MDSLPLHFIGEEIQVSYDLPPVYEKSPTCPDGFTWRDDYYSIKELVTEWHDFTRRGKMGRNMRPVHLDRAAMKGSWGVGRFYFRVRVESGQVFEIYYDRAPGNVADRKGSWFLFGERVEPLS